MPIQNWTKLLPVAVAPVWTIPVPIRTWFCVRDGNARARDAVDWRETMTANSSWYCMVMQDRNNRSFMVSAAPGVNITRDVSDEDKSALRDKVSEWLCSLGLPELKTFGPTTVNLLIICEPPDAE